MKIKGKLVLFFVILLSIFFIGIFAMFYSNILIWQIQITKKW